MIKNNLFFLKKPRLVIQYLIGFALVICISGIGYLVRNNVDYQIIVLILLFLVSFLAILFDILPVIFTAFLSAFLINFLFIPPYYTLHIDNPQDVLLFAIYLIVVLVSSILTYRVRHAEKALRKKEERDGEMKFYSTILNSLSHELRTPIATILGAVDLLKESKISNKYSLDLLIDIEIAGQRLNKQVENLLNINRLENGMLTLRKDWCDVNDLIYSVLQKFDWQSNCRKIEFKTLETLPLVKIDSVIVGQVLYNLVNNAILYSEYGSIVTLNIGVRENILILKVMDNGKGFIEEEIKYLFDKFYRSPRNKSISGTGLGLSISKGFVEVHGGIIVASNLKEGGALIAVEIPVECSYLNQLNHE